MKKIEDYLHLYPKVAVAICEPGVEPVSHYLEGFDWYLNKVIAERVNYDPLWIKPILRPLDDITENELAEFQNVCGLEKEDLECLRISKDNFFNSDDKSYGTAHLTNISQWATGVFYLLSKHFDLFNLIDIGLAIDKAKSSNHLADIKPKENISIRLKNVEGYITVSKNAPLEVIEAMNKMAELVYEMPPTYTQKNGGRKGR